MTLKTDFFNSFLGPVLTTLIMDLRDRCYYNPETGERRDYCWPSLDELAGAIGVKDRKTVMRALKHPLAELFVRVEARYRYDPQFKKKVRTSNVYHVAMDDPLLPEDEEALNRDIAQRLLEEQRQAKEELLSPKSQKGTQAESSKSQKGTHISCPKKGQEEVLLRDTQQHVVVALSKRGVSENVAQHLAAQYPEELIEEKIELHDWLVESDSPLVERNPAGYLRQAIEDNYAPPQGFKTTAQRQREAEEKLHEQTRWEEILAEREEHHKATDWRARVLSEHQILPQTQELWDQVQRELSNRMTRATHQTYIHNTLLLLEKDGVAQVAVSNELTKEWLTARLYKVVQTAMSDILGQQVELEFKVVR